MLKKAQAKLAEIWPWEAGRQNKPDNEPGYFKRKLAEVSWPHCMAKNPDARGGFDCYLLKYEPHYHLPAHTDSVPAHLRHYRLNIVLRGQGDFQCEKTICNLFNRVILFRPDLYEHAMQNDASERIVLSVGVAI